MRAAVYDTTGPSQVLRITEVERPEPGPGQVRVRVELSGVNPTDWKTRAGVTARPIDGFAIPNQDGSGVIDAVGPGVDPSRIGERVWVWFAAVGQRWGTAAEWTVVPAGRAVPLPEGASFELGASLGVPALTAHRCLFADGPIDGQTVLVAGGAGAVGHFAIELAKRAGARVVTTVSSPEKADLARAAGADLVVNYRSEDPVARIREFTPAVDRVVEVALGANLALDLEVAAPLAPIVCYAASGDDPVVPVRAMMSKNLLLRFVILYGVPEPDLARAVSEVGAALAEGRLSELPNRRYALADTAAAHDAVEHGFVGKVLVEPA
ncbi:MAG: NADPH:quinone reductase [Acidobacteriota bacterium]|nr:NADPH:quinone reductase [Acidobacteriota bacterium]